MYIHHIKIIPENKITILANKQSKILGYVTEEIGNSMIKKDGHRCRSSGFVDGSVHGGLFPEKEGTIYWFDNNADLNINVPERYLISEKKALELLGTQR